MAIGIDRYRHIQPLSYAQEDAQALQRFFVADTELLLPQECLLLTDSSPWIGDQSTYPSRQNIFNWLNHNYEANWQTQPPSVLWFFFSGYGVSYQGKDYLMPIDGKPSDPETTGIPVSWLLDTLEQQQAQQVVVLLDINRSSAVYADKNPGHEAVALAEEKGIALILSSQLDEFSHESATLGQGLFTSALLEALRHYPNELTLADLEQYLSSRLPELSEHHWRPNQKPLFIIPNLEASRKSILPNPGNRQLTSEVESVSDWEKTSVGYPVVAQGEVNGDSAFKGEASTSNGSSVAANNNISNSNQQANQSVTSMSNNFSPDEQNQAQDLDTQEESTGIPLWQEWLIWGGSLLLILAAVVFGMFWSRREVGVNVQNPQEAEVGEVVPTDGEEGSQPPADGSQETENSEQAAAEAEQKAQEQAARAAAEAKAEQKAREEAAKAEAERKAQEEVAKSAESTSEATPFLASNNETADAPSPLETNQAILEQARAKIIENQASNLNDAIEEARKVERGTPLFRQARQDIKRWSLMILDIAKGRAAEENFSGAIAAAQLVPNDDPAIHEQAQQSIEEWKLKSEQQQTNLALMEKAQGVVRRNQASTYNRALDILRPIEANQPVYEDAEKKRELWSQQIYLIANSRAARGDFPLAVQTAQLVPSYTSYYQKSQQAIARWQEGKR